MYEEEDNVFKIWEELLLNSLCQTEKHVITRSSTLQITQNKVTEKLSMIIFSLIPWLFWEKPLVTGMAEKASLFFPCQMEFLPTFGTRWVFMSDLGSLSGSGSSPPEPRCSLKQAHIPTYVTHGVHNETKYNAEIDLQSCSVVSSMMEPRSVQLCVYSWTHCSVDGIVWWAASNVYNSRLLTTGFMPVTTSSRSPYLFYLQSSFSSSVSCPSCLDFALLSRYIIISLSLSLSLSLTLTLTLSSLLCRVLA